MLNLLKTHKINAPKPLYILKQTGQNNSMTIKEKESTIIDEFELFDNWVDKYNFIIETGKSVPPLDPVFKQDQYLIKGCQSQVWLHAAFENGMVVYKADSDALITRGIVGLLIRVLSNQPPSEIIKADLAFIEATGLKEHLSPTRSNGLANMIRQMKMYALAFSAKQQGT